MKSNNPPGVEIIIPLSKIKAVWFDSTITQREAAALLGIAAKTLRQRVKAFGLPPRPPQKRGRKEKQLSDPDQFADLWQRGTHIGTLSSHFGIGRMTLYKIAKRMGLPKRSTARTKYRRSA